METGDERRLAEAAKSMASAQSASSLVWRTGADGLAEGVHPLLGDKEELENGKCPVWGEEDIERDWERKGLVPWESWLDEGNSWV